MSRSRYSKHIRMISISTHVSKSDTRWILIFFFLLKACLAMPQSKTRYHVFFLLYSCFECPCGGGWGIYRI